MFTDHYGEQSQGVYHGALGGTTKVCGRNHLQSDDAVPEINYRAAKPPHVQIAQWLRKQIAAGRYEPDIDPLPSEQWLQDSFGVARDTVRRAIARLRDDGLVYTVAGRGTYVVPERVRGHESFKTGVIGGHWDVETGSGDLPGPGSPGQR
jgi:DNA-binding transcriptional regulator YhcF (GntR family)